MYAMYIAIIIYLNRLTWRSFVILLSLSSSLKSTTEMNKIKLRYDFKALHYQHYAICLKKETETTLKRMQLKLQEEERRMMQDDIVSDDLLNDEDDEYNLQSRSHEGK